MFYISPLCFFSFWSIFQTFSSQAFSPRCHALKPRLQCSFVLVLFSSQLSLCAAEWSSAYYLRPHCDWTYPAPPGGPKYCKRGLGLFQWKAPMTLEWGAAPWEPAKWTIWGGEGAGHPNSPLPSIMWALCCAYPETLWLYHLLSFYPAKEGEISLLLLVQSGQTGRDQSTWIKGLVCSRQSWNWSITGLHLWSVWEGVAGRSTEGFPVFAFFCLWLLSSGFMDSICYREYCSFQA